MGFLDKLLGRDKTAAGEPDDKSVKGEDMHQEGEDMHQEQKDSERPSATPPTETIDPQFIKDTERKASQ